MTKLTHTLINTIDIIKNYTPITKCQRIQLIVKQAILAATDYHNGVHYSHLTDLTSYNALTHIHHRMTLHETGRQILSQKPRITNSTLEQLQHLNDNTFGKQYYEFMKKNEFKAGERPTVKYIPDLQLAYVAQRYKEVHDLLHLILIRQPTVHDELLLKWFQMVQLGLPSAALAAAISPILSPSLKLSSIAHICTQANKCQFIMNIYFERLFKRDLNDVRAQLNI